MTDKETKLQDEAADKLENAALAVELGVLGIIAKRLGGINESTSYTDAAVMWVQDQERIEKEISKGQKAIAAAGIDAIAAGSYAVSKSAEKFYKHRDIEPQGIGNNERLASIAVSGEKKATEYAKQVCRTSVIRGLEVDANGKRWVPIRNAYISAVTDGVAAMAAGKEAYTTTTARLVRELNRGGLRVQYASGNTRQLYSAVRMNLMDTYRDTMNALREQHGREFGADGVEVSVHALCATDHLDIQGNQYPYEPREGYKETFDEMNNGLDRPIGTLNCYHHTFPVILGVSSGVNKEAQEAARRESLREVKYTDMNGNEHTVTAYEGSQRQRQLESNIRLAKQESHLQSLAGNTQAAESAAARAKNLTAQYKSESAQMGLITQMDRTKIPV